MKYMNYIDKSRDENDLIRIGQTELQKNQDYIIELKAKIEKKKVGA